MNTHMFFNRQIYLNSLKAGGLDEKLAITLADGLDQSLNNEVALKSDLKDVETTLTTKIDHVEATLTTKIDRVDTKIDHVEATLTAKIDRVEASLKSEMQIGFAQVDTKIAQIQLDISRQGTRLIIWAVALLVGTVTIGAATAGFIFKHIT